MMNFDCWVRRCAAVLLLLTCGSALAVETDAFVGRFVATEDGTRYQLQIDAPAAGRYRGTLSIDGQPLGLTGQRRGEELVGDIGLKTGTYQFILSKRDAGAIYFAGPNGDSVLFQPEATQGAATMNARQSATSSPAAGDWPVTTQYPKGEPLPAEVRASKTSSTPESAVSLPAEEASAAEPPANSPAGTGVPGMAPAREAAVVINGHPLTPPELAQLRQLGLQVQPGQYWYDAVCGAWGFAGGPTMGFLQSGIPVGAPLPFNASNGNTGVFVNGRHLPVQDLQALQSLTGPIQPGRYFIDHQGLAGYEGGPPMVNLVALAAQSRGAGGSNTWQSSLTGASGFSDGTTGAVFFKDGGFSSVGH